MYSKHLLNKLFGDALFHLFIELYFAAVTTPIYFSFVDFAVFVDVDMRNSICQPLPTAEKFKLCLQFVHH